MKDNSPVEKTCPKINRVKTFIDGVKKGWDCKTELDKETVDFMLQMLEEIRSDNERLRAWGNEQFQMAEQFRDLAELASITILEGEPSKFAMEKEKIKQSF